MKIFTALKKLIATELWILAFHISKQTIIDLSFELVKAYEHGFKQGRMGDS